MFTRENAKKVQDMWVIYQLKSRLPDPREKQAQSKDGWAWKKSIGPNRRTQNPTEEQSNKREKTPEEKEIKGSAETHKKSRSQNVSVRLRTLLYKEEEETWKIYSLSSQHNGKSAE